MIGIYALFAFCFYLWMVRSAQPVEDGTRTHAAFKLQLVQGGASESPTPNELPKAA